MTVTDQDLAAFIDVCEKGDPNNEIRLTALAIGRELQLWRMADQPAPKPGTVGIVDFIIKAYELSDDGGASVQGVIYDMMIERRRVGIKRYGRPLEAHNGRDSLRDLAEEIADAFQYSEQAALECRKIPRVRALAMTEMLEHIKINIDSMLED